MEMKYVLNMALPSYSSDGINSRGYAKGDVIDVNDLHAAGLAAAGYFDLDRPVEDKEIKGAPEVQLGAEHSGLKPPFFDKNDQLQDGGLNPGAADLVQHEARGENDPENQPKVELVPGEGERVVQPGGMAPDQDHGPTGTLGSVDTTTQASASSDEGDEDTTGDQANPNAKVRIPKAWADLGAADMRALADRLQGEPTANKAEAQDRIQAEVDRRAAERAAQ